MIDVLERAFFGQQSCFLLDFFAVLAMHHGEQVVRPVRQMARAAVTQRDERKLPHALAEPAHIGIGNIPHHHAIGVVTELAMTHHHAEALDVAARFEALQAFDHVLFAATDLLGNRRIRPRHQRQPLFDGGDQREFQNGVEYLHVHFSLNPRSMK